MFVEKILRIQRTELDRHLIPYPIGKMQSSLLSTFSNKQTMLPADICTIIRPWCVSAPLWNYHENTYLKTCCIALDSTVRRVGLVHWCDEGCDVDFVRVTVKRSKMFLGEGRYIYSIGRKATIHTWGKTWPMLLLPITFFAFRRWRSRRRRYRGMNTVLDTYPDPIFVWKCSVPIFSGIHDQYPKVPYRWHTS